MNHATPLSVPQVNVNDDTVLLVRWTVAPNAVVAAGDAVCEVETTKAVSEVTAPAAGVLLQSARVGARIAVGALLGVIAPTQAAAAEYLAAHASGSKRASSGVTATPKARALADQLGVSLDAVFAGGVTGTIKESDVRRFHDNAPAALPFTLASYVDRVGPIPPFDAAVAASLRRSTSSLLLTSVDMDCRLAAAQKILREAAGQGRMVSVLHVIIAAVARALPKFDRLMLLSHEGALYRYKSIDVAFVARAADGRLFTPVIRNANEKSVDAIATESQAKTLSVMRGKAREEDLQGAAFTISQVTVPGTTRVVALPSFGQSAILGISAERAAAAIGADGKAEAVPTVTLTLNYDHAICDGMYGAAFLAAITTDVESGIQ